MKTPIDYLVDNFKNFGKSKFGGIKFINEYDLYENNSNNGNNKNNDFIELMILLNFTIICIILLILAYLIYSFIAINKIFISNDTNSNKYKIIAYISLVITGGSTGWIFILLWLFGITY
jgi:hypothetical protein